MHSPGQPTTHPQPGLAQVHLLSGFGVMSPDGPIELPSVGSRLVAYLALQDRPVSRAAVARDLWPSASQGKGQASLRSTLWRIRKVCEHLVSCTQDRLALCDRIDVDVDRLLHLSRAVEPACGASTDGRPPMELFTSELLPDWCDDWVLFERERFRLTALQTLDQISSCYHHRGDHWTAAEYALLAIRLEPLRESSHRALVRAHLAQGNLSDALNQYCRYRDLLQRELGVDPTDQMTGLIVEAGLRLPIAV